MRFVLDENLPPAFARSLDELSKGEGHKVLHIRDLVDAGTADEQWISELAEGERSAVISGDRRMLTRPHELQALRSTGLTTFTLAPGWSHLRFWDKAWLLTRWWPTIVELASAGPDGRIFQVPHRARPTSIQPLRLG